MTRGRIIAVVVLTVTVGGYVYAQPKSAGVTFSPDRAGASYQNYLGDDAFWNMDVAVDYGNCVLGQGRTPGIRAAVGYNFIVWKAVSGRGESRIYAGPGATVGFAPDRKHDNGGFGGISGNFGYEYDFPSSITLSLGISPTLGVHLHNTDNGMQLSTYTNGLLWAFAPHLGIRYRFGNNGRKFNDILGDLKSVSAMPRNDGNNGKRAFPRFTYGIEWSYIATINTVYHHNFRAKEGFRMNEKGSTMMYASNGAILAHAGINIGVNCNLSVYAGYAGLAEGYAVMPVSLRYSWLFGKDPSASRWLCFIGGGCGLHAGDDSISYTGRIGGGYRMSLSRSIKLDFTVSYQCSYAGIPFSDIDGEVPADRIRRNDNYLSAINIGIGITL